MRERAEQVKRGRTRQVGEVNFPSGFGEGKCLELDKEKLLDRIEFAQKAIHERTRELAENGNGSVEEKQKIGDALASLRTLLNHEVA